MQKKASGTATPGKSPLLPIFERGSSHCRAQTSSRVNSYVRARSCSLFSSFKKGKAFSLRCLSPPSPPQLGVYILEFCRLGCFDAAWIFLQRKRPAWFQIHAGICSEPRDLPSSGGLYSPTYWKSHQTREPRGPPPSGGISAANLLFHVRPAPYGAFTLFFRWRKKSVQKKASGTATPGKSP